MRRIVFFLCCTAASSPLSLAAQRETPPAVGRPKDFKVPPRREFTLANGMKVTLVPFGTVPKTTVTLAVRASAINERANEVWLAQVNAQLMNEGTATRSAAQVAEEAAGMGGDLDVSSGTETTSIGGEVLSEHSIAMIRLIADVALHPRLPTEELERVKGDLARNLAIQKSQSQPQAMEAFRKALYGDHPYGRLFPTEAALAGYTIEQVKGFYTRNFGAQRAHLYVAGVFDAAAVEAAVRAAFGGWARGTAPVPPPARATSARSLTLIDRPDAVQSTIVMGLPVVPPTDSDYVALEVTDGLLGGTFGSRITRNIREDKGYTYSPFSSVTSFRGQSFWAEQADVTTNVTGASLKEIFGEIERLRADAPPQDELTGIKNNLTGLFTLQNGSRGGIISQLRYVDLQGLSPTYLNNYVGKILSVSPETVRRIARSYLRPDQMTVVVVGDKKTVESQVAPYRTGVP